jgi:hypothetical protein
MEAYMLRSKAALGNPLAAFGSAPPTTPESVKGGKTKRRRPDHGEADYMDQDAVEVEADSLGLEPSDDEEEKERPAKKARIDSAPPADAGIVEQLQQRNLQLEQEVEGLREELDDAKKLSKDFLQLFEPVYFGDPETGGIFGLAPNLSALQMVTTADPANELKSIVTIQRAAPTHEELEVIPHFGDQVPPSLLWYPSPSRRSPRSMASRRQNSHARRWRSRLRSRSYRRPA